MKQGINNDNDVILTRENMFRDDIVIIKLNQYPPTSALYRVNIYLIINEQ